MSEAYMQKVRDVAQKVVAWRKIPGNKELGRGSLPYHIARVIYEQEIPEQLAPNTRTFQGLVVGEVKRLEDEEDIAPEFRGL